MNAPSLRAWIRPVPGEGRAALGALAAVVALVLVAHPLYDLAHPERVRDVGRALASRGLPAGALVAWTMTGLQLACAVGLVVRRLVVPACIGQLVLVGLAVVLVRAPHWYVVGGASTDGQPGIELDVLLMACVAAILWARRGSPRRALDMIRIFAAAHILTHAAHAFVVWDVAGMRRWGEGMQEAGFPFGVLLVWSVISIQAVSSCALFVRCLVVPACVAQVAVLGAGIWIEHAPLWFVVGPGEGGMEYSVLLIACFLCVLWVHWPRRSAAALASSVRVVAALVGLALLGACAPAGGGKGPVATVATTAANGANGAAAGRWIASWAASPQAAEPEEALALRDQTLRQIVRLSLAGARVRVHLSNAFGAAPLTIGAAHVAAHARGSAITPGSDRVLTFRGEGATTIPMGGEAISDPVAFALPAPDELAVSLYLPGAVRATTMHDTAERTTYVSTAGDVTGAASVSGGKTTASWYFVTGVDVEAPADARTIVALGDSITDGMGSSVDADHRWPDFLAERLRGSAGPRRAVVNEGISGNCVLRELVGPSALDRLDRDVLAQPGAGYVVVLEGANDILATDATVDQIAAGLRALAVRARARGLKVLGGTIPPFEGAPFAGFDTPAHEAKRQALNAFVRAGGAFDAVVDFDRAVRDPARATRLLPAYDSGDHVHPSDDGYRAMAAAVDLSLFVD
jgi:lysophospholipase L1-like esterase